MRARVLVLGVAAIVAFVGCSSSSSNEAKDTGTGTTTTTVAPSTAPYAQKGPYAVGFTTLHLAAGRRVVVWYPAAPGASTGHEQESILLSNMLAPSFQAKIPASDRVAYAADAYKDAPAQPTNGGYPLVVFSHGFAGFPEQSVTLTTHLASWGFVVIAPDHVERSLDGLLGTAAAGVPKMTDVEVLQATTALALDASDRPGVLQGLVNKDQIVAAGHSAGANAAYRFASVDPRVKAWISYSVGFGGEGGPAPVAPNKPGMVMLGTTDGIIPPPASEKVYAGMQPPKYLVRVGRGGHLVFSDICLIAADKGGVVAIARRLNLGLPESILRLGTDGCTPDHPPVQKAFPAIDQLSVAFFRSVLGIDATPVGLDTNAVANLGAAVTLEHAG